MVPPPATMDLAACLLLARAGDATATNHLCALFEPQLRERVTREMGPALRRWTDPEDIVQAALFEVVSGLESSAEDLGPGDFVAKLHNTARSRVRDAARRHRHRTGESVLPESDREPRRARDADPSMGTVTRGDARRWLAELVARLPERYAEPVRLIGLQGLSFAEAGAALGLSPDTVRKRYQRARDALRERLAHRDDA